MRVSELALGTMTFGEDWGWGSPQDEAKQIYDAFREAGGNFVDTANFNTSGSSERFVGEKWVNLSRKWSASMCCSSEAAQGEVKRL
jgi:aryl-alcohol dehydrogenase-like predicted oxidoreductase